MIDRETTARLLLQKAVVEELRGVDKDLRDQVSADMRPGDATVAEVAGVSLGRVRMDKPRESVRVDEAELLAWALEHMPEQVETVQRVRPGFVKAVADAKGHLPERTDYETGEVIPECQVPGVTVTTAASGVLTVSPTTDARILARVWVAQLPAQLSEHDQPEELES